MIWDEVVPVEGIEISYRKEGWELHASWPQRGGKHEVVTQVRVDWHGTNPGIVMSTKRVNILSVSAVNQIITVMNRKIGERHDATIDEIVHTMCEDLMRWYKEGKAIDKPDPTKVPEQAGWLMYPIWPAAGATAVAAAPGSYKSFIAEAIGLSLATGTATLHMNTRVPVARQVLYLDWEADADTFASRLGALCRGAGLPEQPWIGYKQMSARLSDVAIGLSEEIGRNHWEAVIIDSMSAAIGGGMVDDDAVNAFWDAVRALQVPALVIAHKSADNIAKKRARFFGSIMSEARVRMAWNAEKSEVTPHVLWECFKDNNTGHIGDKLGWEVELVTTGEGEHRKLTTVGFTGVNPNNIMLTMEQEQQSDTQSDRLLRLLEQQGPMTTSQIAAKLKTSTNQVRSLLSRHDALFSKDQQNRWGVRGSEKRLEPLPDPM